MSERAYVRKDDYYGGDVWVEVDEDDSPYPAVRICWDAFGRHGSTSLNLQPAEAKALAGVLSQRAQEIEAEFA